MYDYPFFEVEKDPQQQIATLFLNRPRARNAMDWPFWRDLPLVVDELEKDPEVRCVIVAARGKSFSTGLDIIDIFENQPVKLAAKNGDEREELLEKIQLMQSGFNKIARGKNIYIAAVQKHCIGGGVDLIAACDLRLGTKDSTYSIREAAVAIVADMGSLQRLPAIIGQGNTRMMALTAADYKADRCQQMGLLNEVYDTQDEMMEAATKLAAQIARNPTMAVTGTKAILNYGLDNTQTNALENVLVWNTAFIDTNDLHEMGNAFKEKRRPKFK